MKKHVKKVTDFIHSLAFWQLVITILIIIPLALYGLRQNSETMGELKIDVISADTNNEGIEEALSRLATYVFSHMNTSTSLELVASYERAVEEVNRSLVSDIDKPGLYDEAVAACPPATVDIRIRVECVSDYVLENTSVDNPAAPEYPDPAKYYYSFAAPFWSPDLAGWSIVAGATSLLLIVFKLLHKKDPDE